MPVPPHSMLGNLKWYNKLRRSRIGMVDLKEGDRVSFEAVPDRSGHGLKAINVKRV